PPSRFTNVLAVMDCVNDLAAKEDGRQPPVPPGNLTTERLWRCGESLLLHLDLALRCPQDAVRHQAQETLLFEGLLMAQRCVKNAAIFEDARPSDRLGVAGDAAA